MESAQLQMRSRNCRTTRSSFIVVSNNCLPGPACTTLAHLGAKAFAFVMPAATFFISAEINATFAHGNELAVVAYFLNDEEIDLSFSALSRHLHGAYARRMRFDRRRGSGANHRELISCGGRKARTGLHRSSHDLAAADRPG
jgi:hypothetical protein